MSLNNPRFVECSEQLARRVYKFTAQFIRGRAVKGSDKAIQTIEAEVDAATFLSARHRKLCKLRISEATERQVIAKNARALS